MIKLKNPFYWLPDISHPTCERVISEHGMRAYGWICFTLSGLQRSQKLIVPRNTLRNYGASAQQELELRPVVQALLDEYWDLD